MDNQVIIPCTCRGSACIFTASNFDDESLIYLEIQNNSHKSFFKRLVESFKYLFLKKNIQWWDVVISKEEFERLKNLNPEK